TSADEINSWPAFQTNQRTSSLNPRDLDDHASWMNRAHRRVSKDTSSTETTTTETHGLALSD
ncbi:hypothetical protein N9982_02295, partial [Akkermansiaceae bacterium]|nr:hypothetical protein [Akkermansiaceae bacterium]MDB4328833.1 hypothetical protein [Akkermansiaceae bacterium]